MGEFETQLVSQVVEKTQSELILFLVIVVIAMILVLLPLYVMFSKDKRAKHELENIRQDKYIAREAQIIDVIKENSAVIAGLKTTLEVNGTTMMQGQDKLGERLDKAVERIDKALETIEKIHEKIDGVFGAIEGIKANNYESVAES